MKNFKSPAKKLTLSMTYFSATEDTSLKEAPAKPQALDQSELRLELKPVETKSNVGSVSKKLLKYAMRDFHAHWWKSYRFKRQFEA